MGFFKYGNKELEYLKKKDKKLGAAIERHGVIERRVIRDPFAALVNSIVSQQISAKAAVTVWNKMLAVCGEITPRKIAATDVQDLQKCSISLRKATCIQHIGKSAAAGDLNFAEIATLPDEEIVKRLSALPGVGVWTAEMLLIFSLERPDVVSWGDLGIRRGMMNLYGLNSLNKELFDKYRQRYSPYGSIASFYLWKLATEG